MNSLIIDFHTHRQDAESALISVDPRQFAPQPGRWYSVGFHPWHGIDRLTSDDYALLEQCASHSQVLAIGETGIDRVQGAPLEVQAQALVRHLHIAHRMGKPVVIHSVRSSQDILSARRSAGLAGVALAIHGMRGNEHVARTLINAGCYLSFGTRFNPAALLATPLDRLLIETDDDTGCNINDVADGVASVLGISTDALMRITTDNAGRFLYQHS